ncbi:MAG: magnesium transporter CorA family protein [Nanoarchaeota archaeon]
MMHFYKKGLSDTTLITLKKVETACWINLVNPTDTEINFVSKLTKVETNFFKSALDLDEKPRIEIEDNIVLIIVKVPHLNENSIVDTIPLSIIITPKNFITISAHKNVVIEDFIEMHIKSFFTTKTTRFCLQIMARANRNYQKHLSNIEKKIEIIEKSIHKSLKNEEIIQLLDIQKSLVYINTAIVSNEKVLEKIMNGKVLKLYEEDKDLLEDIIIDNKQSIDMVNIYSSILSNTMDAYASLISNNLNIVMKFLASMTIILSIPVIVSSFYGMNVRIPFEDSRHAFLIVLLISFGLSLLATIVFIKKKFF